MGESYAYNPETKKMMTIYDIDECLQSISYRFSKNKEEIEYLRKHDEEVHGYVTTSQKLKAGGCIGGRYTYEFIPTSIGTIGNIKCSCGEKFTFSDI